MHPGLKQQLKPILNIEQYWNISIFFFEQKMSSLNFKNVNILIKQLRTFPREYSNPSLGGWAGRCEKTKCFPNDWTAMNMRYEHHKCSGFTITILSSDVERVDVGFSGKRALDEQYHVQREILWLWRETQALFPYLPTITLCRGGFNNNCIWNENKLSQYNVAPRVRQTYFKIFNSMCITYLL